MEDATHILQAWVFDGKGGGKRIDKGKIAGKIKAKELAWVHLDAKEEKSREWIHENVDYLDPIVISNLLAADTRPRILELDNGFLLTLRGVNTNPAEEPEDMVSLRMWIDPHRIITAERRTLQTIKDVAGRLENGKGPKDAGDFLTMVASTLFGYIEGALSKLSEQTDVVEEAILEDPDPDERKEITDIRMQAIMFRRYILPQCDVIGLLRASDMEWLSHENKRKLQENHDQLMRYVEDLDAIRERAQIVKDELQSILSDKLNKNLYVLSVVAAIFLPLGFLTGLFGINIGGLPGIDNPDAFMIFCVSLVGITALQILIFRLLRWL
ncbi:MAG: zinc transporter ZntB [Pseudobdellovibrionaceae bacterium]